MTNSYIKSITLKGFKKFSEAVTLNLNEINFLVGPNNSGKSSISQILLILKDTFESDDWQILNLFGNNSKYHKQQAPSNVLNWKSEDNKFIIIIDLMFNHETRPVVAKTEIEYQIAIEYLLDKSGDFQLEDLKLFVLKVNEKIEKKLLISISQKILGKGTEYEGFQYLYSVDYSFYSIFQNKFWFENYLDNLKGFILENKEIPDLDKAWMFLDIETLGSVLNQLKANNRAEFTSNKINLTEDLNNLFNPLEIQLFNVFGVKEFYPQVLHMVEELKRHVTDPEALKQFDNQILDPSIRSSHIESIFSFTKGIKYLGINRILNNSVVDIFNDGAWSEVVKSIVSIETLGKSGIIMAPKQLVECFESLFNTYSNAKFNPKYLIPISKYEKFNNFMNDSYEWIDSGIRLNAIDGRNYSISYFSQNSEKPLDQYGNGFKQLILIYLNIITLQIEKRHLLHRKVFGGEDKDGKLFDSLFMKHLIVIEEPEIFLHPNFEARLTDLFVVASNLNINFILETHSEYLLLRSQGLVKIRPELEKVFSISYFDEGKPSIRNIGYNKNGTLKEDFGKGFYDQASNLIIDLYKDLN